MLPLHTRGSPHPLPSPFCLMAPEHSSATGARHSACPGHPAHPTSAGNPQFPGTHKAGLLSCGTESGQGCSLPRGMSCVFPEQHIWPLPTGCRSTAPPEMLVKMSGARGGLEQRPEIWLLVIGPPPQGDREWSGADPGRTPAPLAPHTSASHLHPS